MKKCSFILYILHIKGDHFLAASVLPASGALGLGAAGWVVAGLGAAATLQASPKLVQHGHRPAEVLVLAHGQAAQLFVLPPMRE